MKKKPKPTKRPQSRTKTTKHPLDDHAWVVGLVGGDIRAKSFEVAHAKRGRKLLCGRSRTVRWAGYKRRRIERFIAAAGYERRCKRCLLVLFPPRPRRRKK